MQPKIDIAEWEDRRRLFYRSMKEKVWDYQRYARWFRNEFSEIRYPIKKGNKIENGEISSVNLTGLVGRSFLSQLFFSAPEVQVKPVPGFQSDALAQVLTNLGNDMVEKGGLFEEGSKCLLDAFLGPFMCMKVGYNADFVKDLDKHEAEQARAEDRLRRLLMGNKVRTNPEKDNHKIFLDVYTVALGGIKRGDIKVPVETLEYLNGKIKRHRELLDELGPVEYEKVTAERVWFRRQAPDAVWFNLAVPDLNSMEYIAFTTVKNTDELKDHPENKLNDETVPAGTSLESEENEDWIDERLKHYLQIDASRDHFIQHEVIDLRNSQVVVYLQGRDQPLRVANYGMKDILKNGAAVLGIFDEDPRLIVGIPQPKFWESQQIDACILNTVQLNTAKANVPGMGYDKDHVDEEEIEAVVEALGNRTVGFKDLDKRSIKDVIGELPAPKTTAETFSAKTETISLVDRFSGLGQVKLGGGDFSRSATASELVNQAASAMVKRAGKKVDKFFQTIICYGLRLIKAYYSPQTVASIAGANALEVWQDWTPEEIVSDYGVEILVDTMREISTAVERKQILDLYSVTISSPLLPQTPALQTAALKLLAYLFRLHGAPIDLSQEISEVARQTAIAAEEAEAAAGGGAPGEAETRQANVNQPVANLTGGGRGGGG